MLIGFDVMSEIIKTTNTTISNWDYIQGSNAVFDELEVKDIIESYSKTREEFELATKLLARFNGNMEAGNLDNKGMELDSFLIRRRKISETEFLTVGTVPFQDQLLIEFTDRTAGRDDYVYSIVPVASNGLEGIGGATDTVSPDFAGWWLVDKDDNSYFKFDTFIGNSEPTVNVNLVQGASLKNMFSQYPSITYNKTFYHIIKLNASVYVENNPQTNLKTQSSYETLLSFIRKRKPFVLKGGNGAMYIVDIKDISNSTLLNNHRMRDYMDLELEFIEIQSEKEYYND